MSIAYRTVSKNDAATPELACEFIRQDSGGVVAHASGLAVVDEGDCWRVPVWSSDGRAASMPLPLGAVFPSDSRLSEKELDRQINQFGIERREFESKGCAEPGWTLGIATDNSTHNKQ
jgi:hypothetical protein